MLFIFKLNYNSEATREHIYLMQCGETEEVGLLRDKRGHKRAKKKKDNTFLMIFETMDPVL